MRRAAEDASVAPVGHDLRRPGLRVVEAAPNSVLSDVPDVPDVPDLPESPDAATAPLHAAAPEQQVRAGLDPRILAACFESVGAVLAVIDESGRFEYLNAAARSFFHLPLAHAVGRPFWAMIADDENPEGLAADFHARLALGDPWQHERLWADSLGDRHRVVWNSTVVTGPEGRRHVVAIGVDVTEQRRAEASLRQQAQTDPLTGILNRSAFEASLTDHLDPEAGLGCGLLFCDLDGFKAINDTLGHAAGDAVLVEVARRLAGTVRGGDLVARLGGDEFVVLLPALGAIQVRALAARVERTIARPIRLPDGLAKVGVSVGVRVATPGEESATVLAEADAAMYDVKRRRHRRD